MCLHENIFVCQFERISRVKTTKKQGGSVLYVASHCLPFHANGYAFRTQELIKVAKKEGINFHIVTRPGYPWDRRDSRNKVKGYQTVIDGLVYNHIPGMGRNWPLFLYAFFAAKGIANFAQRLSIRCIHAASNHVNALPALLAARKLGVPFQYEVRGFWELSRAASNPLFTKTFAYKRGLYLEKFVARHADRVFCISYQVLIYIHQNFGIPLDRLRLLPNCVDEGEVVSQFIEPLNPCTIVYAGTLNHYEGLDILLHAVSEIHSRGIAIHLKVIGDGPSRKSLEELTRSLQLSEIVRFFGKIPREDVMQIITTSALVCIPRLPCEVCAIVPPLKLVEAMALAKPLVVPDLQVFRDEIGGDSAGLFFRPGDPSDLAQVLRTGLSSPEMLRRVGEGARSRVLQNRIWSKFVADIWPSEMRNCEKY